MSDELLTHYNDELAYFRRVAAEFAAAHPKIAGRLRISEGAIEDPHVSRMIEAFAFLNARTRRRIDDDFPEISQAMLEVLYPQYLAPFPSAAIVRFALPADQADLVQGTTIPEGATLEADPVDGGPHRFRTCYPVTVWPLTVESAGLHRPLQALPDTRWKDRVRAVLTLDLASYARKAPIRALALDRLRFFLNAPPQVVYRLYESIFNNALGVVVSAGVGGPSVVLDRRCLQPVGFTRDEGLTDAGPRSFPAYRLMTEYFAFPEKFLFFDLGGLGSEVRQRFDTRTELSISICLDRYIDELERNVSAETFQLGCCPTVNLFRQRAEPIRLTQHRSEYQVVPDARRPRSHEVYSIDKVVAVAPDNREVEFLPFYALSHHQVNGDGGRFWHSSRRPVHVTGATDDRTDVFVSVVDSQFDPGVESDWTLDIETTCLNPRQLPFGGDHPRFQLAEGGPLDTITCLTPPTRTRRPTYGYGSLWRLISHLTLNHLSLVGADGNADALREILALYDVSDSEETRHMIDGLLTVQSRPAVGRPGGPISGGVCRGLEVTLHFDEDRFTGSGVYLFGSVLEHFLGMYCAINSFTRTVATTNRREGPLCRWPARAGEMVFL